MRKVDDGEEKKKKEKRKKEKNGAFSGHYVIASSLPSERLRPNDDRWNAARSCQNANIADFHLLPTWLGLTNTPDREQGIKPK